MKFGKNLIEVIDLSNPEWGQFWINYKFLKRKINDIVESRQSLEKPLVPSSDPKEISKNAAEVDFFILIRKELKKTSQFFTLCQQEYLIRWERIWDSYLMLQEKSVVHDKNTWTRLLMACVRFYKDVLLLENFAIMNYCGFSKILKKHDKVTGFVTRDAFMTKVMNQQNITHYPKVLDLIRKSEQLFQSIQSMESVMPLQDEERLFIDAIRDMNHQASRMQAEEKQGSTSEVGSKIQKEADPLESSVPRGGQILPPSLQPFHSIVPLQTTADSVRMVPTLSNTMETSDRLNAATISAVEAAKRLNDNNASPNLGNVLNWMQKVGTGRNRGPEADSNKSTAQYADSNESSVRTSNGTVHGVSGRRPRTPSPEELLQDMKRPRVN